MQEELLAEVLYDKSTMTKEDECRILYRVKDGGLLATEIVPHTHLGTFSFTRMEQDLQIQFTWDIAFDTTSAGRSFVWQAVTEQIILDTYSNNLVSSLATPKLYTRRTLIRQPHRRPRVIMPWKFRHTILVGFERSGIARIEVASFLSGM